MRIGLRLAGAGATVLIMLAGLTLPLAARADGDPASDVLAAQALFVPGDAGLSARDETLLQTELEALAHDGAPLRVAIIASPADLGSVGALWNRPQDYARFLGQELALVNRTPLLVVMPAGFGVSGAGRGSAGALEAVTGLPRPGSSPAHGALTAVARIAHQRGLGVAVFEPRGNRGSHTTGFVPWIALAAGAAIIAAAWIASLRAQPLRRSTGIDAHTPDA